MKIEHVRDYVEARRAAYPKTEDFIEAFTEKELGDPAKWAAYLKRVADVKAKFPKLPSGVKAK